MVLLLGGVPVSVEVFEGGVPKFYGDSKGGVSFFYTHKKRNRTKLNIPFAQFPRRPGWIIARFTPAALISFRHPGGGVPIFDSNFEGGVPKFYGDSEGGYAFFTGTFLEKDHPPPLLEILNSP